MKQTSIFLAILMISLVASAQHIVEWRFDRTGVFSKETGLMSEWPAEGPEMLWYFQGLGNGHSSVAIAENRIFVTGEHEDRGFLYVFDLDGNLLHEIEYGPEWTHSYAGSRSTVVPYDGRIYVVSGMMFMVAYDIATMRELWRIDHAEVFGTENIRHGWVGSPLIVGEKLIIAPGGEEHNIVALNRITGEVIWTSRAKDGRGAFNAPIFLADQEVPQVVVKMTNGVIGIDISNGELLWHHPHAGASRQHPNTLLYHDNMLFSSTAHNTGMQMLRLTNGGRSVEQVWTNQEINNRNGHAVRIGDYILTSNERPGIWFLINWYTSEIVFSDNTLGTGLVIFADGMFYIMTERNEMLLVRPNMEHLDIVSRFPITMGTGARSWAHPVIYNGVLFIRHGDALMAYRIK
jgi:hypothetical protein